MESKLKGIRHLEIYLKNGKVLKGTTHKMDLDTDGFYIVSKGASPEQDRRYVKYSTIKFLFIVTHFLDKKEEIVSKLESIPPGSHKVSLTFKDGQVINGYTFYRLEPNCERFYIIPQEGKESLISILVQVDALTSISMDPEVAQKLFKGAAPKKMGADTSIMAQLVEKEREEEKVEFAQEVEVVEKVEAQDVPLSRQECMGDFYFSIKDYHNAYLEYKSALKLHPTLRRLQKKVSACHYNKAVHLVRIRQLKEALAEFEQIGEEDPLRDKALRKMEKITKILAMDEQFLHQASQPSPPQNFPFKEERP